MSDRPSTAQRMSSVRRFPGSVTRSFFLQIELTSVILTCYQTTRNIPVVTGLVFDVSNVRVGGSFAPTCSGSNLTDKTYFDVHFRGPGGTADEVVLNWQQGTSLRHTVPSGAGVGAWTITGVRSHQDVNDRTGPFVTVSATPNVKTLEPQL